MSANQELLARFEAAIRQRNPKLADRLLPGLPEDSIRSLLNKGKVEGSIKEIVALFSWKNGTLPNAYITPERPSLFPDIVYILAELDLMIAHFAGFREIAVFHPRYSQIVGRYFPLFWNGSMDYLAVDLEPANQSRIVSLANEDDILVREAYGSFQEFLKDAIWANQNNKPLACTKTPGKPIVEGSESCSAPTTEVVTPKEETSKKIPSTGKILVLRTDFSDEAAWKSLYKILQDPEDELSLGLDFISDQTFNNLAASRLPSLVSESSSHTFAFIVDRAALTHSGNPVLVIDVHDKPGRTFRVTASALAEVANNLSIANMDFDEFIKAADKKGIFRGFSRM